MPKRRRKPWTGETPTVPQRVTGQRVVAAIKLATTMAPSHQWEVVLETGGDTFAVAHIAQTASGVVDVSNRVVEMFYGDAVMRMVGRVGSLA